MSICDHGSEESLLAITLYVAVLAMQLACSRSAIRASQVIWTTYSVIVTHTVQHSHIRCNVLFVVVVTLGVCGCEWDQSGQVYRTLSAKTTP